MQSAGLPMLVDIPVVEVSRDQGEEGVGRIEAEDSPPLFTLQFNLPSTDDLGEGGEGSCDLEDRAAGAVEHPVSCGDGEKAEAQPERKDAGNADGHEGEKGKTCCVRPTVFDFATAHPLFATAHFRRTKDQDDVLRMSLESAMNEKNVRKVIVTTKKKGKKKNAKAKGLSLRSLSVNDIALTDAEPREDGEDGDEEEEEKLRELEQSVADVQKDSDMVKEMMEDSPGKGKTTPERNIRKDWDKLIALETRISQLRTDVAELKGSKDYSNFWSNEDKEEENVDPLGHANTGDAAEDEDVSTPRLADANAPADDSADNGGNRAGPSRSSAERETSVTFAEHNLAGSSSRSAGKTAAPDRGCRPASAPSERPRETIGATSPVGARHSPSSSPSPQQRRQRSPSSRAQTQAWQPCSTQFVKPFSFLERDAEQSKVKPISQVKLEQHLRMKELEEERMLRHQFKAKKIPRSVKESRYENIVKEQMTLRIMKNEARREKLLKDERPFAFYLVDKKRKEMREKKLKAVERMHAVTPKTFIANEVPSSMYEPRYELLKMEEKQRMALIKERAKKKLLESKMPPRMEMGSKQQTESLSPSLTKSKKKSKKKSRKSRKEDASKQSRDKHGYVPDYKKLHSEFEEKLMRAKASNSLKRTIVKEFMLGGKSKDEKEANQKRMEKRVKSIIKDIERDAEDLKELRWPYMSKRGKFRSTPPPCGSSESPLKVGETLAAKLRASEVRKARERGQFDTRQQKEARRELQRKKEAKIRAKAWEIRKKRQEEALRGFVDPGEHSVSQENVSAEAGTSGGDASPTKHPSLTNGEGNRQVTRQHVLARHKQVAEQAARLVEKVLLNQSVDAFNFVKGEEY